MALVEEDWTWKSGFGFGSGLGFGFGLLVGIMNEEEKKR